MRLAIVVMLALVGCAADDSVSATTAPRALTEVGSLNNCLEVITAEGTSAATGAVTSGDASAIQRTIDACAPAQNALDGQLRGLLVERQSSAASFVDQIEDGTATEATATAFNADTAAWFDRVELATKEAFGT
jgi:hypothetical protein